MIAALLLGRKGSKGFPGKNTTDVLDRPLAAYPMLHAQAAPSVDVVYLSTDDPALMEIARSMGVEVIERPDYLASDDALGEDAFRHGYEEIKRRNPDAEMEAVVLLFCNAVTFTADHIEKGVSLLRENEQADSAVTVSCYNWYSPARARRINASGYLDPFIPFENYPDDIDITCDRDAQGDVYFADVCVSVIRPHCLENMEEGLLPQKWMGQTILPIDNWGGLDVDAEWQMPLVKYWLEHHGFTATETPYG